LVIGLPQVKMPGNEKAAVVGREKAEKKSFYQPITVAGH